MKRELERIEIPGEHDARRRTWEIVRAAYRRARAASRGRAATCATLALAAAVVAVVAAALTPPGRSVVNSRRARTIGVEHARARALHAPRPGRLLVQSDARRVGRPARRLAAAARRLPRRVVVAARPVRRRRSCNGHTLVALEPDGTVRWEKPQRRRLAFAALVFEGYRIAYFAGRTLRVIDGDGTGDAVDRLRGSDRRARMAARDARGRLRHAKGVVLIENTRHARRSRRLDRRRAVRALHWSTDGRELLVTRARSVDAYFASGRTAASLR